MPELEKAFVIGGFSEDLAFLEAFTNAVSSGPDRIVEDAEPITLAYALRNKEKLNDEAAGRVVFAHSAALLAIEKAGVVVAMNAAEPTKLARTVIGAVKTSTNKQIGREPHVAEPTFSSAFVEVAKHPSTWSVPFRVRSFSSLNVLLTGGRHAFPGGRFYLPSRDDEFGFGRVELVDYANKHGIVAQMLEGFHNQPLLHPNATVKQIHDIFEQTF